tara:strand:- start:248 stop:1678 length:1431 start_codon:yes stop_codon:yes gene_type:complete
MRVVGFSEGYHDAAITVLEDNRVLFAGHSERFSKVKNDKHICEELKQYARRFTNGLKPPQIAFYERPFLKRTRQIKAGQWKTALGSRRLSYRPDYYFAHHLSHAAAGFQSSPFDYAIALVVDAIGEWDTISTWQCSYHEGKARYRKLDSIKYPTSLGLFYSAVTDRVGLKPMEDEYITMGMAAFGKYQGDIYQDMKGKITKHNYHKGMRGEYEGFEDVDIAHNAQILIEAILKSLVNKLSKDGPIVFGGGVALNSVANGKIFKNKEHYIFPNPGDAGSSLGAAALIHRKQILMPNMFVGYELPLLTVSQINEVVDLLEKGEPVGIAAGKAEFGPRALGNRSLLCDPRTQENKDRVNDIKRRQQFRPFAPSILAEHAGNYFRTTSKCDYSFMQYVVRTRNDDFKATMHSDGTARVHTVEKDRQNSSLRQILECWYGRTGCPALLNTSLNIKGMPMVNDAEDARDFEREYGVKVFCNG